MVSSGPASPNARTAGRLGTGFNILVGPVVFRVPDHLAAEARELLQDLGSEPTGDWEALEDE